jgi:hypothetical protein
VLKLLKTATERLKGRSKSSSFRSDKLNGRGDYVCIRCGSILGATVQSECLEMETC